MHIKSLESRRLLTATMGHAAHAAIQPTTVVRTIQSTPPKTLGINLVGSYSGFFVFSNNSTYFTNASMTIVKQTAKTFSGTVILNAFKATTKRFTARIAGYRARGPEGAGYYAAFHYSTANTQILLRAAIVPGEDNTEAHPGQTALYFFITGEDHGVPIRRRDNTEVAFYPPA